MPHVRIWVYDGILASGVAGAIDVFTAANDVWARRKRNSRSRPRLLEWRIESLDGKSVQTASGQIVNVDGPINARANADAVLIPGPFVHDMDRFLKNPRVFEPLFAALRRQHARGATLASYCTGSFILAEAGLLDGHVAPTHWRKADVFAKRYPDVDLRISEILTEQNRIICSRAVTTSLNLALRIVEKFAGPEIAMHTGRTMLIDVNRAPQSSYATLREPHATDPLIAAAQRRMRKGLGKPFSVATLAGDLAVSQRTLNRRFKAALGEAPLHHLQTLRMAVARRLLETSDLKIQTISNRLGYSDVSTFRRLFKRLTKLSPQKYQMRFARRQRTPRT